MTEILQVGDLSTSEFNISDLRTIISYTTFRDNTHHRSVRSFVRSFVVMQRSSQSVGPFREHYTSPPDLFIPIPARILWGRIQPHRKNCAKSIQSYITTTVTSRVIRGIVKRTKLLQASFNPSPSAESPAFYR